MIQLQVINKILETGDFSFIINNGVNDDFFSEYLPQYKFIKEHFDRFGNVPDKATFFNRFPDTDCIEVNEGTEYLVNSLYDDRNTRILASVFQDVRNKVVSGNIQDAVADVIAAGERLVHSSPLEAADLIECAKDRYDEYLNRSNDFNNYYIKTGFPELDGIIGGWDRHEELVTIAARTNQGKCLAKGTKILMADGTLKNVEDVKVGDFVQSYNRVNKVLALHNGVSNGYHIKDSTGDEFTVSSNHILTCHDTSTNILVDLSIEDYIALPSSKKKDLYLFRPSVKYPYKKLKSNPYSYGRSISSAYDKPFDTEYLTSSYRQRLDIIAGLIDNSGEYEKNTNCFKLYYIDRNLFEDVVRLCKSVGFKVVESKVKKIKNVSYFCMRLYGNLTTIPTITRGKSALRDSAGNQNISRFKVTPVDTVEYYGFMCDGDSRYMLSNYILTHNTWILFKSAESALEQGLRVGIYEGEMSPLKVGFRMDTFGSHISNIGIMRGDRTYQNSYKTYLDNLGEKYKTGCCKILTPTMIGGLATVSTLRAFIEKYNLDILFIDQHSLLEDERKGRSPVEKASNISKDLKNLQVMKKIPIITVSQQNRSSTENGVNTEHIAQSDRIAQDSTIIIFFEQDKESSTLTMHLVKSRDSAHMKNLKYVFDFDNGIFEYIPDKQDDSDDIDADELEKLKEEYRTDESIF